MSHSSDRLRAATTLQPVIAELLRTCVHPPVLTLRVDHLIQKKASGDHEQAQSSRTGRYTKLFLTDGQLLIQALLHHQLSGLPEIKDLNVGDIVEINDFVVRKAQRSNGQGHVVYLGIENCYVVKAEEHAQSERSGNCFVADPTTSRSKRKSSFVVKEVNDVTGHGSGGFLNEAVNEESDQKRFRVTSDGVSLEHDDEKENTDPHYDPDILRVKTLSSKHEDGQTSRETAELKFPKPARPNQKASQRSDSDEEDAFETVRIDLNAVRKRRQALHEFSQNVASSPSRPSTRDSAQIGIKAFDSFETPSRRSKVRFEVSENDIRPESDKPYGQSLSPAGSHHYQSEHSEAYAVNRKSNLSSKPHRPAWASQILSRPTTPIHTDIQTHADGPLKSLASLFSSSLPSKSFVFTTIIVPTYVAPYLISRPNSPFPPKRHLKVIDPSLAARLNIGTSSMRGKGITVSVYRNAANFKPTVGRAALMRGVVMQRLNSSSQNPTGNMNMEVILNVYPEKLKTQKESQQQQSKRDQNSRSGQGSCDGNGPATLKHTVGGNITVHKANIGRSETESSLNKRITGRPSETSTNLDEPVDEAQWFIDDHDVLHQMGYNVTVVQQWWDQLLALRTI